MKVKSQKLKVKSYPSIPPFTPLTKGGHRGVKGGQQGGENGFTLIELVMTMALIGIIAFVVANSMSAGFKAYFTTDFRNEALNQARIAMERMSKEIRNVRSRTDIGTANAAQFCFINTDGARISFRFSANTIIREEPAACPGIAGNTLAGNITSFTFAYLQSNGSADPAPPTNTKRIRITFTSTISSESITLQSEVWPRSL